MNLSLKVIIISFVTVSWGRAEANEQETLLPVDATPVSRMESKTKDKSRSPGLFGEYWWANRFLERHKLVESLRGKSVDLVMVGDSITHYWEWKHPESWAAFGIHPTEQGYEIWSKVLHAELLSGDVDSGEGQKME